MNKTKEKYLKEVYLNTKSPVAYSGLEKVWNYIRKDKKVTKKELREFLLAEDVYTSYLPSTNRYKKQKIVSPYLNYMWMTDTAYMIKYANENQGHSYFVVFIDTFSRYLIAEPLKTLKGVEMTNVVKQIFKSNKCENLFSDSGSEYTSKVFNQYLKSESVRHFYSRSDTKSSMAERVIKTIKGKLLKYMDENNTKIWVDVLQDFVSAYNRSYHSTIKMTPTQATQSSNIAVWKNQYENKRRIKQPPRKPRRGVEYKFNLNDYVKLVVKRYPFQREYNQRYTTEIFKITSRKKKGELSLYNVKDLNNEGIIGDFQDKELTRVFVPEDKIYKIDKVIKTRKRNNRTEYFVSWKGWPKKFNSWVSDIEKL